MPGVYAVGDLVAGLQLAHRGFAHGIFVAEEIAHRLGRLGSGTGAGRRHATSRGSPTATPRSPRSGSARRRPRRSSATVETLTYDLGGNGKSQILKTQGFVKLVRRPTGPVVGVHLIGARVGELIGEAQLITSWDAFPSDVAGLLHAHPTQSEALGEAHLALAGKPLHTHG